VLFPLHLSLTALTVLLPIISSSSPFFSPFYGHDAVPSSPSPTGPSPPTPISTFPVVLLHPLLLSVLLPT